MISGSQIRMARGFLKWSTKTLAQKAGLGVSTVRRMESVDGVPSSSGRNLDAIQKTLEDNGIIFIEANEFEPGIRAKLQKTRPIIYKIPDLKLGMWVKIGTTNGIVCRIYENDNNKVAEIVYDDNRGYFFRNTISWLADHWVFDNDTPISSAEQDPFLAHYIAELRLKRR